MNMPGFTANASLYKTRTSYHISYEFHQMPHTNRVLASLMVGDGRPNPCRDACKCCIHTYNKQCCYDCDDCLDAPTLATLATLGDRGTFTLG
jgi:hypothetical protein